MEEVVRRIPSEHSRCVPSVRGCCWRYVAQSTPAQRPQPSSSREPPATTAPTSSCTAVPNSITGATLIAEHVWKQGESESEEERRKRRPSREKLRGVGSMSSNLPFSRLQPIASVAQSHCSGSVVAFCPTHLLLCISTRFRPFSRHTSITHDLHTYLAMYYNNRMSIVCSACFCGMRIRPHPIQ